MPKKIKAPSSQKVPRPIIIMGKVFSLLSSQLATRFAVRLFTTPIKHKIPKREWKLYKESKKTLFLVPAINKEIMVYEYGKGDKKVLLVHGWSGRGTQLVKIAEAFAKRGYQTIGFDAPAHGNSKGEKTLMIEFIASILALQKQLGPFEFAIGHSLGGMSILNALNQGFDIKKAVIIGSGDKIDDIISDFITKVKLAPKIGMMMKNHFESKYQMKMDDFSSSEAIKKVTIPVLIIHDENDLDIPLSAAKNIFNHAKNGELYITKGLGHRKILGDESVIKKIEDFISV